MLFALVAFLLMSMGVPSGFFGTSLFAAGLIPFILDASVNLVQLATQPSTATVEEIRSEGYQSMKDSEERNMVHPSERVLPRSLREGNTTNFMLTQNWKDNAADAEDNSVAKQLTAFAMLLGFLGLGGVALSQGNAAAGALSLAYGSTGLIGYLGFKLPPLLKAINVNATAAAGAVLSVGSMLTGGLGVNMFILAALFMVDFNEGL